MGGGRFAEPIGGVLRVEQPISNSGAVTVRVGRLQVRFDKSDWSDPIYFAHGGYREYADWFYLSMEAGAVMADDGGLVLPSGAVTLGGKWTSAHLDIGLSVVSVAAIVYGVCAHVGVDFASW